jgi:hypothetical protein
MTPNEPSAHFCVKCGAPLTSYAATAPFESQFAQGHAFRQAAEQPRKLIVVLGVWMIFGPIALAGVGFICLNQAPQDAEVGWRIFKALMGFILTAIPCLIIWKTTRNYLMRKKTNENHDA